jgi:hypothetical protein
MRCIGSRRSWRRRKEKSGKGESQSAQQTKHSMQKEATHHTQTAEDTIGMDLEWTTSSTLIGGICHEISIHLSYQSMNKGILYQRHQKWHL